MVSAAVLLPGTVDVWIDEEGHTYLTDSGVPPAPDARRVEPGDLALQWGRVKLARFILTKHRHKLLGKLAREYRKLYRSG